ncbi:hypothetical protein [Aquibacillus rhizosphaerae]|uniref:Uncharacterized protein n=1 Tax=Aquibacillus rhizosphaerae TaxID=3051431 RepID=A0ABT7LAS4_9BACI|nr:hypothetical protein [Aquibacillus sp. LR5S19]MDL4842300.1 hypothetical protein [Aquibacillus sp. LR5S19]
MRFIVLIISIILLLFIISKVTSVEKRKIVSMTDEVFQNFYLLLWGIGLIFLILFIPYQVWRITGSSYGWGGAYIFGFTVIAIILLVYYSYSKFKLKRESIGKERIN